MDGAALFQQLCSPCHGSAGAGDGPAAHLYWPPPTDLRGPLKFGDHPDDLARGLVEGLPDRGMPGFSTLSGAEIAALVDVVTKLGPRSGAPPRPWPPPPADLAERAPAGARLWREAGCATCHGPDAGGGEPLLAGADLRGAAAPPGRLFDALTWGRAGTAMVPRPDLPPEARWALVAWVSAQPVRPHRPPPRGARRAPADPWWATRPRPATPAGALPILREAEADRCGRCHPSQHARWLQSRHARAMGPGVTSQYLGRPEAFARRCDACHAPVEGRRTEGVGCAACHVRAGGKAGPGRRRAGPPAPAVRAAVEPRFGRADFCLPCHNQVPGEALAGRPLLDTWREWAASPYLPGGVQCQHCHMPDGDHGFAGAHDPAAVRRALALRVSPAASHVEICLSNVGAGHHVPTTPTPRIVVQARLLQGGAPVAGSTRSWAVGRTVSVEKGRWVQQADTRIPAGGALRWRYPDPGAADAIEVSVSMFPDWYYMRIFRQWKALPGIPAAASAGYRAAWREADASGFEVLRRITPLR